MGKDRVEGDFKAGKIDQKEYEIRKGQITCGSFFQKWKCSAPHGTLDGIVGRVRRRLCCEMIHVPLGLCRMFLYLFHFSNDGVVPTGAGRLGAHDFSDLELPLRVGGAHDGLEFSRFGRVPDVRPDHP